VARPEAEREPEPERVRPPTDLTDLIPRSGSRTPLFVGAAIVLVAAAGGAVWYATKTAAARREPVVRAATATAARVVAPAVVDAPPVVAGPTVVAAPPASLARTRAAKGEKHHARTSSHGAAGSSATTTTTTSATTSTSASASASANGSGSGPPPSGRAHLTVTADVQADAYIDGQYVRATPIVDYELAAGRHTVHLESAAPGLRLIPRDRTVELKPGELKEIRMELK
jgi:hypothetical protein